MFREQFIEGSSEIVQDEDHTSLQWRILDYLVEKELIENPDDMLKQAFDSAKAANINQCRQEHLGEHGTGNAGVVAKKRVHFTPVEQWLCYQAAAKGKITPPFNIDDFTSLVGRALRQGSAKEMFGYMAAARTNYDRRINDPRKLNKEGQKAHLDFNPAILVMSLMWVFPPMPFWLLPSRVIAHAIHGLWDDKEDSASEAIKAAVRNKNFQTIDATIKGARLCRISEVASNDFFATSTLADKVGKALLDEITAQVGFDIQVCFGGRRPGT